MDSNNNNNNNSWLDNDHIKRNYSRNQTLDNSPAFEMHENVIPITMDEYIEDDSNKSTSELSKTINNETKIKSNENIISIQPNLIRPPLPDEYLYWKIINESIIYDLIPKSNKVIVLDVQLKVKNAFYALHIYESRGALLWNSTTSQFDGMFTITDFITTILAKYPYFGTINDIENAKISTWRDICCSHRKVFSGLIFVTPDLSLNNAFSVLSHHRIHRLATLDENTFNPIYIVTHKRILHYIYLKTKDIKLPHFYDLPLSELMIGTFDNIHTISYKTTIRDALTLMIGNSISALPVVDDNNKLVDIYSKSDASMLAHDRNYTMLDNCITNALLHRQLGFEGVLRCKLTDTLRYIIKRIVRGRVHRLIVVNDNNNVIGIVSLSDILQFLYRSGYNPYFNL